MASLRCFMSLNISLSHSRSVKVIRNNTLEYGICKSLLVFHCTPCPEKRCHWFFAVTFTNIDGFFVHNFMRECQSHWRNNFLPYIRSVATIPCESLRHKSNTFHTNISTLHMFISITFTEISIDETNKTQQKVRGSKFMFIMSTIHANSFSYQTA